MANTLFIKIPNITGSATTTGYDQGHIDLGSMQWGAMNANTDIANATGTSAGIGTYGEFSFTKELDTASAALLKHCLSGKHITDDIVLTATRSGGDDTAAPVRYLEITMTKSMITSYSISGQGGEGGGYAKPSESFSIATAKFKMEVFKQGDDGSESSAGETGQDAKTGTVT